MVKLVDETTELFNGQGYAQLAPILSNGFPGSFRHLGNCDALSINNAITKVDKQEQMTGSRGVLGSLITANTVTWSADVSSWSVDNIGLALRSAVTVPATAQSASRLVTAGDLIGLEHPQINTVVVTDPAGPTTYTEGVDYEVDEARGMIKILDANPSGIAPATPMTITYNIAPMKQADALSLTANFFALRFTGLNTARGNKPVLVNMFKVEADPVAALALVSPEGFSNFTVGGNVLLDTNRATGSPYYNWLYADAA